ncbi:hypothetical protein I4U23_024089 [Adineta vaga]|nr:hypothetical protein I4U23_024089 [Adineta vaga]
MFLLIVLLSYVLGCATTIAILIYLYIRYGLGPRETIPEQNQYQTFQPIPENFQSKNPTIDTVNYIFQFLFQEMKDTSKIRRYIIKKLNVEFNELKNTRIGKFFLRDIVIQSFSLGRECPILTDIQYQRHERDERNLIKEFQAKFHADYQDGFSITLDITLAFNQKCQLCINVKRIQGYLRLELRREPFSHWLLVFQGEPLIDLDIKSYLSNREAAQLSQIIKQQICRAIRRKQIWPNYKIRYQPFFPTSKRSSPDECLAVIDPSLIPGKFYITIKSCDRLSIPYEISDIENGSSLFIFLTININKHMCEDYLCINRDQWKKYQIEFRPHINQIRVKEVLYMDRIELLIEELKLIPNEIENRMIFEEAFDDRNVFLLQIQGENVHRLKQVNRLLKYKSIDSLDQKIQIVVGIPVLHSVRIPRAVKTIPIDEELTDTLRRRLSVRSDSTINSDNRNQVRTSSTTRAVKQKFFNGYDQFNHGEYRFPRNISSTTDSYPKAWNVGSDEQFLNICLWCKPPLESDVPNIDRKYILLGYTTIALSEVVLNAHMSFKRETQMTLNFRSANSSKSNIDAYRKDPACKKLAELTTHKNFDDQMAHGFVTLEIRHEPEIENIPNHELKREDPITIETITVHNEQLLSAPQAISKLSDHIFEDQNFSIGTNCCFCHNKIWMKVGRQCRNCLATVHRKCEDKFSIINFCTHEHPRSRLATIENDLTPSKDETKARRSFRAFANKTTYPTIGAISLESPRTEQLETFHTDKRLISTNQTSSKLVSVAASAYNKLIEFRAKRSDVRKPRSSSVSENISEDDLQMIFSKCLTDENIDTKSLEDLFREQAVDHAELYAKANAYGVELFQDLDVDERKLKLENDISRVQQEINLQDLIRDELIIEMNNNLTDENFKRKIQAKITNVDEKVQALAALTILYCSGLKHCYHQLDARNDSSN